MSSTLVLFDCKYHTVLNKPQEQYRMILWVINAKRSQCTDVDPDMKYIDENVGQELPSKQNVSLLNKLLVFSGKKKTKPCSSYICNCDNSFYMVMIYDILLCATGFPLLTWNFVWTPGRIDPQYP